jgi:hypothetical protein
MHQEWTDDMSNDPLNKHPVSDLYPHGAPMSSHCPSAAIKDLPPPLIESLQLLHQHIEHLADQVLLLQSAAQHVHHPAPQDSKTSVPSPFNRSSSTTSKQLQPRSYSHVVTQSRPPPASLLHQDHPTARNLASQLRSPSALTPSPLTKIHPPVEQMAESIYSVAAVISPNKFEVFLPATSRKHLQTILQEKNILRILHRLHLKVSVALPPTIAVAPQLCVKQIWRDSPRTSASSLGPSSGASASIASISSEHHVACNSLRSKSSSL